MKKVLQSPHPIGYGWSYIIIPTVIVLFILIVLAPYGFGELNIIDRTFVAIPFLIITAIAAPIHMFLAKRCFPKIMDENQWNIGKELLYNIYDIGLIGVWNTVFLKLTYEPEKSFFSQLLEIEIHTYIIGIIPLIALIAYQNNKALQQQLSLTQQLNGELKHELDYHKNENEVALYSEKGDFELKLSANRIMYFKSEGNYVEVFYFNQSNEAQKHLVRNRLKNVTQHLSVNQFFQCHRSYIINIEQIKQVEGNARDLKLTFADDLQVPVSRTKSAELLKLLKGDSS